MLLQEFIDNIKKDKLDAFLITSKDEFLGEYVPIEKQRLKKLTDFSGSNGYALILSHQLSHQQQHPFFTDGRYTTQAKKEINPNHYTIHNLKEINLVKWLALNLSDKTKFRIGFFSFAHTINEINNYKKLCTNINFITYNNHPLDGVVAKENNALKNSKNIFRLPNSRNIFILEQKYCGSEVKDKIQSITNWMVKQKINVYIPALPESICWLLNIRGNDVPYIPIINSYIIIYLDQGNNPTIELFANIDQKEEKIITYLKKYAQLYPIEQMQTRINFIVQKQSLPGYFNIVCDFNHSNYYFYEQLTQNKQDLCNILHKEDICIKLKSVKNNIEINNIKNTHIYDGIAVTKFLFWLEQNTISIEKIKHLNELFCVQKILDFRKSHKEFVSPSFDTIAAFAENGAIIHYCPNQNSNKSFTNNNLFLIDSGGQYYSGTTDITRTILIGETATKEQKNNFTLVLKGHIALSNAIFPKGTTGSNLDILARQYLWRDKKNYDHGTGHGVGNFLSVHEGPQRISPMPNNVALEENMVISNEPGYYKENAYGIRIENLIRVKEISHQFLCFEDLTLAPIDFNLIDKQLLSLAEKKWLYQYHLKTQKLLSEGLGEEEKKWLNDYVIYYHKLFTACQL